MLLFLCIENTENETDQEYLETLYKQYRRLMFSTIMRYVSEPTDCEDILQDGLEKLCKKVEVVRAIPKYAVSTYIVYTMRSTAINHQMHKTIVSKHTQELLDTNMESTLMSPQDYAEYLELKEELEKAWARLPAQDQELLFQKYVCCETNTKLAETFHCSESNIRMKLFRAKKKVIKCIKERCL